VPKVLFKPPDYLVDEWPEVFEDLYISTMPVEYLHSIRLEFKNGRIWEVAVKDQISHTNVQEITKRLIKSIHEYSTELAKVEFKIDVNRLKTDIQLLTKNIL
jgi:ABC-type oligopeptide transport system ATPase subunit